MTHRATQPPHNASRKRDQDGTNTALMTNQEEGATPSVLVCPKCRARVIVHVQATATCLPCARQMIDAAQVPSDRKSENSVR